MVLKNSSILVIEDNPDDFVLLQYALWDVEAGDVRLTRAGTLRDALEHVSNAAFDLALLDLSLPDTDGLEGLQSLQRAAPHLPVLVITGRNDSELAARAVREGAQDYLIKGNTDGQLLLRAMRYAKERMQVLRELKRSEERFRSLLENALDLILVLGRDGRVKYVSPSTERVLGYPPEELTNDLFERLFHPDDAAAFTAELGSLKPGHSGSILECRVRRRDGEWRVLEAFGRNLIDDPSIEGLVINARDITERKRAESLVRESNERLRAVIEACPLPIYSLDLEGRVLSWSPTAEEKFGWTESETLGEFLPPAAEGEARSALLARLESARAGRTVQQFENRYRRKDGHALDVTIWNSLLRDEQDKVTGVVSIAVDISDQRRLEEQVRQAQKMEAIGRLAGGVAHDFNNLLTVITGYSQLALNRQASGTPAAQELREVLGAADRAASLTKQLLALSRRHVVAPGIVDVNSLVSDMERMLRRIIGEDVAFRTRPWSNIAPVRANRAQLELVLLNLVINARDAMPDGGTLEIETAEVDLDASDIPARKLAGMSGRAVVLSVSDTGTGMSQEVRAHLFEPFFTTKEPGKGTGLGLSTSYGIIRQHGGDIWVDSEPGLGTTFKIYLPAVGDALPVAEASHEEPPPQRGNETILLVEDETAVADIMAKTLRLHGYRVLVANLAEDALEYARSEFQQIDLLISDMVLQSVHGVDLARQIKEIRSSLPVLFISGYAGAARPGQAFLEPGAQFLQKPFSPDTLAAKVGEMLKDLRKENGQADSWAER